MSCGVFWYFLFFFLFSIGGSNFNWYSKLLFVSTSWYGGATALKISSLAEISLTLLVVGEIKNIVYFLNI